MHATRKSPCFSYSLRDLHSRQSQAMCGLLQGNLILRSFCAFVLVGVYMHYLAWLPTHLYLHSRQRMLSHARAGNLILRVFCDFACFCDGACVLVSV